MIRGIRLFLWLNDPHNPSFVRGGCMPTPTGFALRVTQSGELHPATDLRNLSAHLARMVCLFASHMMGYQNGIPVVNNFIGILLKLSDSSLSH
jgi:hypothetical protein